MTEQHPQQPDRTPTARAEPRRRGQARVRILGIGLAAVLLTSAGVAALTAGPDDPAAAPPSSSAPSSGEPANTPTGTPTPSSYQQAGPPKKSPLVPVDSMTVTVSDEPTGTVLPEGLIGLSLEATDLADDRLSGDNPEIVESLKGLGKPLLRFGGNAVDRRFFWTSSDEEIPGNLHGDEAHPVRAAGPEDLERIDSLLEAADATISLTVPLGDYDPARAADMAEHASAIFGQRLVGITVGNEPNAYAETDLRPADWGVSDYLQELSAYANAIEKVAPDVPIVGPGTYSEDWWTPFAEAPLPQEKVLSIHHYPLSVCDGDSDPLGEPVMENLVAAPIHIRAQDYRQQALAVAAEAGLDMWIPETGISACPGSNETTETHASALWSSDYALSAAQLGIPRLGFHSSLLTCTGGPPMSAICAGGPYLEPDDTFRERANYYGLSMVASLPPGGFLKTSQKGGGLAYSYAVRHQDGSLSVVLINENDPEKNDQTDLTLNLPAKAKTGAMSQLTGPALDSENKTEIDGEKAPPPPLEDRPVIPGFTPGTQTVTLPVTAGTVTVLTFTF